MKIVACAMAIMIMAGEPVTFSNFSGFIMMLGITMVAAPGVPGGLLWPLWVSCKVCWDSMRHCKR